MTQTTSAINRTLLAIGSLAVALLASLCLGPVAMSAPARSSEPVGRAAAPGVRGTMSAVWTNKIGPLGTTASVTFPVAFSFPASGKPTVRITGTPTCVVESTAGVRAKFTSCKLDDPIGHGASDRADVITMIQLSPGDPGVGPKWPGTETFLFQVLIWPNSSYQAGWGDKLVTNAKRAEVTISFRQS